MKSSFSAPQYLEQFVGQHQQDPWSSDLSDRQLDLTGFLECVGRRLVTNFFTPFLPYIALISMFCPTNSAFRSLPWFLSIYLPVTSIHTGARTNRHSERESAHGEGTRLDRSTLNFGLVWVQTPAACVACLWLTWHIPCAEMKILLSCLNDSILLSYMHCWDELSIITG